MSWKPPTTDHERAIWTLLVEEGVIDEVERLWAEDDAGVVRASITFEEFFDVLNGMVDEVEDGPRQCIPISCPEPEYLEVVMKRVTDMPLALACWDTDRDGECPKCVYLDGLHLGGSRFAICPKRGVFG